MNEDLNTNQPTVQVAQPAQTQGTVKPANKSKKIYIVLAIVLILIIIGGAFFVFTKKTATPTSLTKQTPQNTQTAQTSTKTKVTSQNVDQTLQNTDSAMQNAMNQVNSDLKDIGSINTSQDSTSGL